MRGGPRKSLFLPICALLVSALAAPCLPAQEEADATRSAYPLDSLVQQFLKHQGQAEGFVPTGLTKQDYLKIIQGQVRALMKFQQMDGQLQDPNPAAGLPNGMTGRFYYAAPNFAHAVAVLASSGCDREAAVLEAGVRAMDFSAMRLKLGNAKNPGYPDGHTNFFIYSTMKALQHFQGIVPKGKWDQWAADLRALQPEKTYSGYGKSGNNWSLVYLGGEYLRVLRGMAPKEHAEELLGKYRGHFTAEGQFLEGGAPFAYDAFSRYFIQGILLAGYDGSHRAFYDEMLGRGAWTSLFALSPSGEMPAGFRSGQHIWNEAELAALFEARAAELAKAGKPDEASAFKRGARLALRSISHWLRPDGSGYIVKNRFPTKARHGYEPYSTHVNYNALAISILASAWEWADDAIVEKPAPPDVGGYAFAIPSFHKIIACAGGTYVVYSTSGDQRYNGTGLVRIHLPGILPVLGPSDTPKPSKENGSYVVGPGWTPAGGGPVRLASISGNTPTLSVMESTPRKVAFRVSYDLTAPPDHSEIKGFKLPDPAPPAGVKVSETFTLDREGLQGTASVSPAPAGLRLFFPVLTSDGEEKSQVSVSPESPEVTWHLRNQGVRMRVQGEASIRLLGEELKSKNGLMQVLEITAAQPEIRYSLNPLP